MKNDNFKKVQQILLIILFANLAVAVLKIVIGSIIKSSSMTADGFHSLTDGSSNAVGLIGVAFAARPVDEDHPYGHKKFETLAGLFIAGMLFIIGGKIAFDAVFRFINPVVPDITLQSLIVLIITLGINIFVCRYEHKQGKKLNSYILISDSMHTRSDIYVSVGVLVTLAAVKLGLPPIVDPVASLIISGFILYTSYEIFTSSSSILVDKAAIDTDRIKEIAMSFEQVKDVHKIRSRGSENDLHIDMHIMAEPHMSLDESHTLIHDIERKMKEEVNTNIQVIIHIEPFSQAVNA